MTRIIRSLVLAGIAVPAVAGGALARDAWEGFAPGDNGCNTNVELVHGARQVHDLEFSGIATPDVDWARVQQRPYRSYEVRITNSPLRLAEVSMPARVDCAGVVLTPGVPYETIAHDAVSIRWLSSTTDDTFIRTTAPLVPAGSLYEIELLDSTYTLPRFNNSATQTTLLLVQNTRGFDVTGQIHFFNAAGGLLHSQPFTILSRGVLVLNSSTLAPLVGQSGSVFIAHNGGYGALAGKGVALETTTGFTFDTLLVPKPY